MPCKAPWVPLVGQGNLPQLAPGYIGNIQQPSHIPGVRNPGPNCRNVATATSLEGTALLCPCWGQRGDVPAWLGLGMVPGSLKKAWKGWGGSREQG